MEKLKPIILMICDYYLPGFESGGTTRTLVNTVDRLGEDYDFRIVTRDHDGPLNKTSYQNVRIDDWNRVGNADVYYLSKKNVRLGTIRRLFRETGPDAVYLNSLFSTLSQFTLLLQRFKMITTVPIILAPEGELVPGGLLIKPVKKRLYINATKLLRLLDKVIWKAASDFERDNIESVYGSVGKIMIAPNMPPREILSDFSARTKPTKIRGKLKMVFLSRISKKKNLRWLLELFRTIPSNLALDVYGPIEDAEYWNECRRIINSLPKNVSVAHKGTVSHENVAATLTGYHFFILPTLGENFGHIFVEALAAGCPLIISDRTPWNDLETKSVGWDLPLEKPKSWTRVINDCIAMDNDEYRQMSENAVNFAVAWLRDSAVEEANRAVFEHARSTNPNAKRSITN